MKIVLVTHYYSTHGGGIEIVAGTLAARLARRHDVVWIASDCDPVPADSAEPLRCVPMRSVNVVERLTGLPFPIWGPGSLRRLWHDLQDADVVHLHDVMYFGNMAAFAFAVVRGKPILVTQHVGFIPYRSRVLRFALRAAQASVGRVMLGRADQVVFISRPVKDYFSRFVRFRRPPSDVANGVDGTTFVRAAPGDRIRARESLGLDPAKPVLLFVGRFVEKKGLHILEQLTGRLTDVSWVLAGWGPIDPRGWNRPHVHVFAGRHGATLIPLYHAADLLVLPSVGEGLPLVIQESMSCGTPVMVGEDTAEAVDAPAGVMFAQRVGGERTVDDWEDALRTVLRERSALGERQHRSADFASSRWSWERCAAAYERLFEQLSRDRSGKR